MVGISSLKLALPTHLYPNIDFKSHLPEVLWKEWDALIDWKADFDAELTPEIVSTVSKLQDLYSSPYIYLPFRLPSLDEKAKDSELVEKECQSPHLHPTQYHWQLFQTQCSSCCSRWHCQYPKLCSGSCYPKSVVSLTS